MSEWPDYVPDDLLAEEPTANPPGEDSEMQIDELVVLRKYDGDLTDEEMESAEPIETIYIENGEIVKVERKEDEN